MTKAFLKLSNPFILAPMAGICDIAFRRLCKEYGAGLVYSEMVSANALVRNNKATLQLLESSTKEKPVTLQLFGQNSKNLADAAKMVCENYDFDAIDINFGCPAIKIFNEGAGCALMNRPKKIAEIVSKVSGSVNIPLTAKIRAGVSFKKMNCVEVAKLIEENGASAIAIHGRVAIQGYGGTADWNHITAVKDSVNIPVIGNGDVVDPHAALRMLDETGCDYVMIGRAARGNPHIFTQCNEYLKNGKYEKYSIALQKKAFERYLELAQEHQIQFAAIKIHANYFTKGMHDSTTLREKINRTQSIDEIRKIIGVG